MSRAADQRFRTVAAMVAGVFVVGAVTVGIAHAYYGGERAQSISAGYVRAPVDWVPAQTFTAAAAARARSSTQHARSSSQKASAPIFIPALPNLGGVNPKSLGFQWPVHGYHGITSPFGPRNGSFHHGADIACGMGQPLYASRTGRVVFAGNAGDIYGNTVAIDHGNTYMTVYAHMSRVIAKVGEVVKTGWEIGLCGMTGNATGPHVHFELRYDGYVWDPLLFLP
ncbi:MAG TPA: M23 family metallopeptidase [Actinomycetota bacterium]|nr:M23 family metallopeptidase [Actinomycetota bacterium]